MVNILFVKVKLKNGWPNRALTVCQSGYSPEKKAGLLLFSLNDDKYIVNLFFQKL